MLKQDVSLKAPVIVTGPDDRFSSAGRLWQSAPSAAVTAGGRLWCVYSGDNEGGDEYPTNYTVCVRSDDGGKSWKKLFNVFHPDEVRVSETLLWIDPDGKLWHFWTQSYVYFDGRGGVWGICCADPDADTPVFTEPRRLCDGFMADTPTVLSDGRWLFPASIWTHLKSDFHPFPDREKAGVWETRDQGKSFRYLGGAVVPEMSYTENTVVERRDGSLLMLVRTNYGIAYSESRDGGASWTDGKPWVLPGPSSRFCVTRFPSGTLMIINHWQFTGRNRLTALLSEDDGASWFSPLLLDERADVSYPSGNLSADGRFTCAYDRERTGAREILLFSITEEDVRRGSPGERSFVKKLVNKAGRA